MTITVKMQSQIQTIKADNIFNEVQMTTPNYIFINSKVILQHRNVLNTLCLKKKQDTKLLPVTSPNVNRFSKFFHS